MNEERIDLWDFDGDVRCITTNCTVTARGNVMGGGCALEAAQRYPRLPAAYGDLIKRFGHHVFLVPTVSCSSPVDEVGEPLVMFPVKNQVSERADLRVIGRSCVELRDLADLYGWKRVALPRPGCGLGGLKWEAVRSLVEGVLDDRFWIIDFPGKRAA